MLEYLSADIICYEKWTVFSYFWDTRDRYCPRENIRAYFHAKWRLLCLLPFKPFSQLAQSWELWNISTIVAIWRENMLRYLSADIICSEKLTFFFSLSPRRKQSEDKYRRWRGLLRDNCPALYITWRKVANKITRKLIGGYNLALINRAGGLYGRILTEVVSADRTQWGLYTRPRSRFSYTDRLSSVNKMFIIWRRQEQFNSFNVTGLYWLTFCLRTPMSRI